MTQEPREIAFEDIRKGDRIRVSREHGALTMALEAVAETHQVTKGDEQWFASDRALIATRCDRTITLLHRPAPAEPTGLGAVVRATTRGGKKGVFVRTHPGDYGHAWRGLGDDWNWGAFDPDSIEVLSEGIEVES